MDKIKLYRFWDLKKYREFYTQIIKIGDEIILQKDREQGKNNGEYETWNDIIIAILSDSGKNYLYLKDKLIELTQDISIEYYIAQDRDIKSWLKIFEKGNLIFELKYINPHEPFILPDPFIYDEDFKTTNFAYHLVRYINKVRENPEIVLFPNEGEAV